MRLITRSRRMENRDAEGWNPEELCQERHVEILELLDTLKTPRVLELEDHNAARDSDVEVRLSTPVLATAAVVKPLAWGKAATVAPQFPKPSPVMPQHPYRPVLVGHAAALQRG